MSEPSERGNGYYSSTPVQPITINVSCGECGNQGTSLDDVIAFINDLNAGAEDRAAQRHDELVTLLRGLIDSDGDKDKMRALSADINAKREALKGAIPAQST